MDVARFAVGTPRLAWQIHRLAERLNADLVYINGPRLLPAAAMARLGRPVLFHSHSYLFPGMVRRLAGLSLRRMGAWVVGQCRFVADPWQPFVRPERISVIYTGVPGPEGTTSRPSSVPDALTVTCWCSQGLSREQARSAPGLRRVRRTGRRVAPPCRVPGDFDRLLLRRRLGR